MPLNADTNRVGLSYVEEVTAGETPTNPLFKGIRYTGSTDLKYDIKTEQSKEIRDDRQIQDTYVVATEATGGFNIEFSNDTFNDLIEGAMFNRWQRTLVRNDTQATLLFTDIEFVSATTGKIKFDSSVTTAPFLNNSVVYIDGVGGDFSGAIVEITGGTFSSPDFFHDFTVLNGKVVENITAAAESSVYQCGYIFQDVLQATASPNTLTSATTDMTTLGLNIGQWVKIGSVTNVANDGFDTTADNDFVRIESIATNVLTLDKVPTGWAADTNSGSKNIAIFYDAYIKNGTTEISYSLERSYKDQNPITYEYFSGMRVSEFTLDNSMQSIVTGSFNFLGLVSSIGNARKAGATDVKAPDTTVYSAAANINYLNVNGLDLTSVTSGGNVVTKFTLDLKNNLHGQPAVGNTAFVGVGVGQFEYSGSFEVYFTGTDLSNSLINNSELDYQGSYSLGNRYLIVDVPRLKITSGAPEVSGVNEDVKATYGYLALVNKSANPYTVSFSTISTY